MNTMSNVRNESRVGRNLAVVVAVTACFLMIPLVAMQFTNEVVWDVLDFVVAGALLIGTGSAYVLAASKARSARQRYVIGAVLAIALLVVWAELAVGIFD